MSRLIARRRAIVALILVLLTIVTTETVALATGQVRQGSVEYMKVASTVDLAHTTSTNWSDVPFSALAMPVPSGEHDFFQFTFSAPVQCFLSDPNASPSLCFVRVLVDGQPATPGQVVFGDASVPESPVPVTMQWVSATVLAPGTHYVKLQWVVGAATEMAFTNRTFTVVRLRAF